MLKKAIIDASSIIYMMKADFLHQVASSIELHSLSEIIAETGYSNIDIKILTGCSIGKSNDQMLIFCALESGWPVISEDKKILSTMERNEIPYFNSLIILNYLLFKNQISVADHSVYFRRLKEHAWYSPYVWDFGKTIFKKITGS